MYAREVDGEELWFGHEGVLFERSFVMYDRKTQSLWVHTTGEAVSGPLRGKRLQLTPSTLTRWETWKERYPDSTVVVGQTFPGPMGAFEGLSEGRLGDYGLVLYAAEVPILLPFSNLREPPVRAVRVGDVEAVVVFSQAAGLVVAWDRELEGRVLDFAPQTIGPPAELCIRDLETGTLWDPVTGMATRGDLAGRSLAPVVSHPMLRERFAAFYPASPPAR